MEVVLAEIVPALSIVDGYMSLIVLIVDSLEDIEEAVDRDVLVGLLVPSSLPTPLEEVSSPAMVGTLFVIHLSVPPLFPFEW